MTGSAPTGDEWRSPDQSLVAVVPGSDGKPRSLLRLGAYEASEELLLLDQLGTSDWAKSARDLLVKDKQTHELYPGWLEYSDRDHSIAIKGHSRQAYGGDKTETIGGRYRLNIAAGTQEVWNADPIYFVEFKPQGVNAGGKPTWRKTEKGHNSTDTYSFGDVESFFAGYKFDAMFGLTNNVYVGGKVDLSLAASFALNIGFDIELGMGVKASVVAGRDLVVAGDVETKARKSIHLRVKKASDLDWPGWRTGAAILSGVAGVAVAAGLASETRNGTVDGNGISDHVGGFLGGAAAAFALGLAGAVLGVLYEKKGATSSKTELKLDKQRALLANNDDGGVVRSSLELEGNKVLLKNSIGSSLHFSPVGEVALTADRDVYLQNKSPSYIRLKHDGRLRVVSAQGAWEGQISIGHNGSLKVM